jgi:hypothetical protein
MVVASHPLGQTVTVDVARADEPQIAANAPTTSRATSARQ